LATQAASTYKLPSFSEMPETFNVTLLHDATEAGAVYGSKAVGEPPLMLAFSVREALRQAAAAFAPAGTSVSLGSPATPEAVFWAIEQARDQAAGDRNGDVIEGFPGRVPPVLDPGSHPMHPSSETQQHAVVHA
jgi:xanthine dehydrogenase large subunit